jgi:hypothetical protein
MGLRFLGFENVSYRQADNISPHMRVVACEGLKLGQ